MELENKNVSVDDCYTDLGLSSGAVSKWFYENRNEMQYHNYYHFLLSALPMELIEEEPILKTIHDRFPIKVIAISKFYPYTNHRWHMDTDRSVSLNMLLEHERSHVLFRYPDPENDPNLIGCQRIHELNYNLNHFTLFNTQVEHTITNYEGYRYSFCIMMADKETNYYQVKEYMEQHESI